MATTTTTATVPMYWNLIITLLFVILKLAGYVSWSWIWIVSPLWLPYAFILSIVFLFLVYTLLIGLLAILLTVFE